MNIVYEVDMLTEKALGICWNLEKDALGFKTNQGERPLTRRGMLSIVRKIYDPLRLAVPFRRVKISFKYCTITVTVQLQLA